MMLGEKRNALWILVGKLKEKTLQRTRCRWDFKN
jgi:hypothetical protein